MYYYRAHYCIGTNFRMVTVGGESKFVRGTCLSAFCRAVDLYNLGRLKVVALVWIITVNCVIMSLSSDKRTVTFMSLH